MILYGMVRGFLSRLDPRREHKVPSPPHPVYRRRVKGGGGKRKLHVTKGNGMYIWKKPKRFKDMSLKIYLLMLHDNISSCMKRGL